jgi:drug/metabolite transporter (DMT)-like permease
VGLFGRRRSPTRTLAAALIALGVLGYRLLTRTPETSTAGFWVAMAVTAVLLAVVAWVVISTLRSRAGG